MVRKRSLMKTLFLLLLASTICVAEEGSGPPANAAEAYVAAPVVSWPQSPGDAKSHRTADKKFWTLTAVTAAAAATDGWTTTHSGTFEQWNPWLYGHEVRPARTALAEVAIVATFTTTSYILKRKHVRYWWVPMVVGAVGSSMGAIHNCRLGCSGQ